jgi:hypothetical protein
MRVTLGASAFAVTMLACQSDTAAPGGDDDDMPADLKQLFLFYVDEGGRGSPAPHAFLINRPGLEPVALTAFHVGGGIDGFAWLRSPINESIAVRLGERIEIPGAQTIGANGSQNDLAAFRVIDWKPELALTLASALPEVGDTVYVLAVHLADGANPHPLSGPRRHPARVDVSHDSAFVYTYLGSANSNFTSGAAVLDRNGNVVGVNVGSRVMSASAWEGYRERYAPCCDVPSGGEVVGLAVHVRSIRRLLGGPIIPTLPQR